MRYATAACIAAIVAFCALKFLGITDLSWGWLAIPAAVLMAMGAFVVLILVAFAKGPS